MKWNGVSFSHTVELLRNKSSFSELAPYPLKVSRVRRMPCPIALEADDPTALLQSMDFYYETLKDNRKALSYLRSLGFVDAEVIDRFRLGYANRALGRRLPQSRTKSGDALRQTLRRIGILRESGHEHFRGCLVIPIVDENGVIVQVCGRRIGQDVRANRDKIEIYLSPAVRGLWNLEALQASKEMIICVDIIDALTFWNAGYRNVVAAYGVDGITPDRLALFKRFGTERVLLAMAQTDATDAVIQSMAETFLHNGIDCYRLHFPVDMSINDFARHAVSAESSLGVCIRAATWMGKGETPAKEDDTVVVDAQQSEIDDAQFVEKPMTQSSDDLAPVPPETVCVTDLEASPTMLPRTELAAEVNGDTIIIMRGSRRYRIRGLSQNLSLNQMKVSIKVDCGDRVHVDSLDLCIWKQRVAFATQAAKEINEKETVIQRDLGKIYLKLEELLELHIERTLAPQTKSVELTEAEKSAALDLLRDEQLFDRVLRDFKTCGVVGEETNKLVGYLAAVSRKLDKPLAVIVQSTSAAGKSSLMDAVLDFVPEEERMQYSAITGQALYYMGNIDLKHKVLALSEEEGAARAAYALKLLQSEGRLTIASTGKKPDSGELVARDYKVEGPVMIFMTTTEIDIDDELLNRCLVLAVDEDRDQTRAIHQRQREAETLEGLIAKEERQHLVKLHQNAQRLLRPLLVVNPYAMQLTFPDQATRMRRDHMKYLVLIRAIALLRQYQREVRSTIHRDVRKEYIEVTLDDIAVANRLAHEVLGRTLDELPPQTRNLLLLLDQMARERCQTTARFDYRFTRREVRDYTGWGDTQLKVHLARLTDLEYVLVHRGGRGQSFVYELLYDGQGKDGRPFLQCLIDVEKLKSNSNDLLQLEGDLPRSDTGRPVVGAESVVAIIQENRIPSMQLNDIDAVLAENASQQKYDALMTRVHDSGVSP
jgi:hypothetical protein